MNTVLITGCSSGYGRATATQFLERGWNVVATMRSPAKVQKPLAESERLRVCPLDVTDQGSIAAAVRDGIAAFGGLDVFTLLACGAATTDQLKRRAAFDLNCPEGNVTITKLDSDTRGVAGCGRRATYVESCDGPINSPARSCTWVLNMVTNPGAPGSGTMAGNQVQ